MADESLFEEIRHMLSNGQAQQMPQGVVNRLLLAAVADLREDTRNLPEISDRLRKLEEYSATLIYIRLFAKYPKFTIFMTVLAIGTFAAAAVDLLNSSVSGLVDLAKLLASLL